MDYKLNKSLYTFKDKNLLITALTHKSLGTNNNEWLELLGDTWVNLVITVFLYNKMKHLTEGSLVKIKSLLISNKSLLELGLYIGLDKMLKLNKKILKNPIFNINNLISSTFEAVIGSISIDSNNNFKIIYDIIIYLLLHTIQKINNKNHYDYKSFLQVKMHHLYNQIPIYWTILNDLDTSNKLNKFTSTIIIWDKNITKQYGKSKKEAEQKAAMFACQHFKLDIDKFYSNIFKR